MYNEVRAVVHSSEQIELVTLIKKVGDNDYLVKTSKGVLCHALLNFFNGLYYADDLYRKETEITGISSDSQ